MHDFATQLDDNLRQIREKSAHFRRLLIAKRLEDVGVFKQTIYETGDFVLRRSPAPIHKKQLAFRQAGPNIVIHNHKVKDVTCRYLVTDVVYVSYVERYNVFIGISKPTIEVVMLYDDWFLVKWTLSCEVDTETRINVYVK